MKKLIALLLVGVLGLSLSVTGAQAASSRDLAIAGGIVAGALIGGAIVADATSPRYYYGPRYYNRPAPVYYSSNYYYDGPYYSRPSYRRYYPRRGVIVY